VTAVEALELATGRTARFEGPVCRFAYRDSRFKGADRGRFVITRVHYRLKPGAAPSIRYPELAQGLEGTREPSLADVRRAVLALRRRKSMVLDEDDPCSRSVGSFFLNPVVAPREADDAEQELRRRGHLDPAATLPRYPAGDRVKLSAAWLIERCGLPRGLRRGPVGLSSRHALAIVNYGGATAREVVEFAREIRDRVQERSGVALRPEPVLVGVDF
jgi:UDP-N-acetylmuramate dehydrogenase